MGDKIAPSAIAGSLVLSQAFSLGMMNGNHGLTLSGLFKKPNYFYFLIKP